jgi:putative transposase
MIRTYRYRLYPSKEQQTRLNDILWAACWLYNRALDYRRKRWSESRRSINYYDQAGMWRDWRNEEAQENPLRLLNMSAGQQVLRRLDTTYKQFLKGQRGFPRFKKASRFNSVNYKPGDGAQVKDNRLYVQNVGLVKVRWHRELPESKLKNIVVVRKPSGWYVLLQIDMSEQPVEKSTNLPAGVDMGITHALALSDGTTFDSPKYLQAALKKLCVFQRAVSRKQRGGKNRRKAVQRVARLYEHIANQRFDWWHKTTRQLVDDYGAIALEDMSLKFMLRNGNLSRSAHDVGLGMFRTMLDYKAIDAGVEIVTVNPQDTSQVCSGCGCLVQKSLSVRIHICPECGITLDRDINAARNILSLGRREWALTWMVASCVAQEAPPLQRGEPSHCQGENLIGV